MPKEMPQSGLVYPFLMCRVVFCNHQCHSSYQTRTYSVKIFRFKSYGAGTWLAKFIIAWVFSSISSRPINKWQLKRCISMVCGQQWQFVLTLSSHGRKSLSLSPADFVASISNSSPTEKMSQSFLRGSLSSCRLQAARQAALKSDLQSSLRANFSSRMMLQSSDDRLVFTHTISESTS